jgi:hypothetical protein
MPTLPDEPPSGNLDLARWAVEVRRLDREVHRACAGNDPRCRCHLCELAGLLADCLWHLGRTQPTPPPGVSEDALDLLGNDVGPHGPGLCLDDERAAAVEGGAQ